LEKIDERVIQPLVNQGKTPVIPPKRNRKKRLYDEHLYQARHLIENFFCKLKQFRAIATRYGNISSPPFSSPLPPSSFFDDTP